MSLDVNVVQWKHLVDRSQKENFSFPHPTSYVTITSHVWKVSPKMQPTLCLVGKRSGRQPIVASAAGHNKDLFFLCDDYSGQ